MSLIVTVDGPAASGKTSVSRDLAHRLGWKWVSTGAFYRGLAYVAQEMSVPPSNVEGLVKLAHSKEWFIKLDDDRTRVYFKQNDVTDLIGAEKVGELASQISQISEVRKELLDAQRKCAVGVNGLVAEGRDCGTVVFPQALVKFFLTADPNSRARRRAAEHGAKFEDIHASQAQRDSQDASRKVAPMKAANGAYTVDTSELTLSQVVDSIEKIIRDQLP